MVTRVFRTLCHVLYLLVVVLALQAGSSGTGGFATPYNRFGHAYDPQHHQQPNPAQQHRHQQNQQEQHGQYNPQQQQQQHGTARVTTSTTSYDPSSFSEAAGATTRGESPPLPHGWGELRTSEGQPYYAYYPTGHVQWERPTPPESDQKDMRQPADEDQRSSPAEPAVVDGGGDGVAKIQDVSSGERELAGSNDDALLGLMEEDDKKGESEMSEAEATERDVDSIENELEARVGSERTMMSNFQSQHVPTGDEWRERQQAGTGQDQPSALVEPIISRPFQADGPALVDPSQRRRPGVSGGGEGSGDNEDGDSSSPPRDPRNDQIRVPRANGAEEPSSLNLQQNQPPGAWEPWSGRTSSVPAELSVFDGRAEGKRPPMWVDDGYEKASPPFPPSHRGSSSGHEQDPTALANEKLSAQYPWGSSPALGGSTVGGLPPGQAQVTNARDQGEWGPPRGLSDRAGEGVELGQGGENGGASDPWLGGWSQGPHHVERDTMRADRNSARDGVVSEAAGSPPGKASWTEPQYDSPPSEYYQPKQAPLGSGGSYDEPFLSPHQGYQASQADGSAGSGSETKTSSNSWGVQEPSNQDPSQWRTSQPRHLPAGNHPGTGEGRPSWSSSAQGGIPEVGNVGGYGSSARLEVERHRQQPEGYYGRDSGDYYYQGQAPGRGAPAESPRNGDEYAGYPAGSRGLVPRSTYSSGMFEGLHLVRGAWTRILVGTGKTRSVLRDYRDWAGIAASSAGVTIKNTVGSVTSRVADVLEGDPQRTSGPGPHGHPPIRDGHYYDGSTSFPPTDRTQEYNIPRSWDTAERPAGYTNLPPQAAGAIRPQLGSPGSDGGYRGNGPGEGNVAASGEYGSGGRRYSGQGGGAKQGDARNEYYGHQQSFPPREPGYTYGTGNSGGRAPFDGGTHDHGPQGGTEGGEGMSSDGYRQQQSLQQRRQPLQQQHQQRAAEVQGRTGQWQSDGISDGGYWAPR